MDQHRKSSWDKTTVTAVLQLPVAAVELLSMDLAVANDHLLQEQDALRLDLSVNPRMPGSVLRFENHWAAQRYEAPGKLFLLPPGETLRVRSGVGRQDAIICRLPIKVVETWLQKDLEWTDRRVDASVDIRSSIVSDLLVRLGEEARHPGFATAVLGEAVAIQIAVTLERYYGNVIDDGPERGLSLRQLRIIDERIRDSMSAPSLSELAGLCDLSVRHLCRGFRLSRDVSLGRYVARARMEAAKRQLIEGESVKGVAYRMGFGSPSTFSYAFRKATGVAPRQFRTAWANRS